MPPLQTKGFNILWGHYVLHGPFCGLPRTTELPPNMIATHFQFSTWSLRCHWCILPFYFCVKVGNYWLNLSVLNPYWNKRLDSDIMSEPKHSHNPWFVKSSQTRIWNHGLKHFRNTVQVNCGFPLCLSSQTIGKPPLGASSHFLPKKVAASWNEKAISGGFRIQEDESWKMGNKSRQTVLNHSLPFVDLCAFKPRHLNTGGYLQQIHFLAKTGSTL